MYEAEHLEGTERRIGRSRSVSTPLVSVSINKSKPRPLQRLDLVSSGSQLSSHCRMGLGIAISERRVVYDWTPLTVMFLEFTVQQRTSLSASVVPLYRRGGKFGRYFLHLTQCIGLLTPSSFCSLTPHNAADQVLSIMRWLPHSSTDPLGSGSCTIPWGKMGQRELAPSLIVGSCLYLWGMWLKV